MFQNVQALYYSLHGCDKTFFFDNLFGPADQLYSPPDGGKRGYSVGDTSAIFHVHFSHVLKSKTVRQDLVVATKHVWRSEEKQIRFWTITVYVARRPQMFATVVIFKVMSLEFLITTFLYSLWSGWVAETFRRLAKSFVQNLHCVHRSFHQIGGTAVTIYKEKPFHPQWYSLNCKQSVLRSEVGFYIHGFNTILDHRPFACGEFDD